MFFSSILSYTQNFLLIFIIACKTTFQGQSLKIIAFQWPGTIFVIWKPIPKNVCFHIKMCFLAIEIISQGMMVKIPTNFFSTFYPKTPKKGSEVHFTCQSWLICKKFKFYIMPYICWPLCGIQVYDRVKVCSILNFPRKFEPQGLCPGLHTT